MLNENRFVEFINDINLMKLLEIVEYYQRLLKEGNVSYEQIREAILDDYNIFLQKESKMLSMYHKYPDGIKTQSQQIDFSIEQKNIEDISTHIESQEDFRINMKALVYAREKMIEEEIDLSVN